MKRNYYRIMLGEKSKHAEICYTEKWFGGGWGFTQDLSGLFPDSKREFNKKFVPVYLEKNQGASKVKAGLACGMLYTICKDIKIDDWVLCPDGSGEYWVGEVVSDYFYCEGHELPHRRSVSWFEKKISRVNMSESLRYSTGAIGTVADMGPHAEEIEAFVGSQSAKTIFSTDDTIEDASVFAMEQHLEEFLVKNWSNTLLGKKYDIFEEDGECIGQQYQIDTGKIDILAISKDKREFLVVELKKGRASDNVVGQIMRYMGFIKTEIAEDNQEVRGAIIALEDDAKIKSALKMIDKIDFYRYEITFKLEQILN